VGQPNGADAVPDGADAVAWSAAALLGGFGPPSNGERAVDDYRVENFKRLEEEQTINSPLAKADRRLPRVTIVLSVAIPKSKILESLSL
jgi:hypothetical protein